MGVVPYWQFPGSEIVHIVLVQLLKACAGYIEELELHFCGGYTVCRPFHDILLATTGGLHHLVNGAVAVGGQETPCEGIGQLIKNIGFLVKPEVFPVGLLPEDGVLEFLHAFLGG